MLLMVPLSDNDCTPIPVLRKPSPPLQAKSDVIRVLLLHKYGGVWADATLCMTEGLEPWLHRDVDFTTFIRNATISPIK